MEKGVLVVGGNPAGRQATLDLAQAGIRVYLVEGSPFLYRSDAIQATSCLQTAAMLEVSRHPNVTVLTSSRVTGLTGQPTDFRVAVQRDPRYVDPARCTACGDCAKVCPVTVLRNGKPQPAIFGGGYGAVPNIFVIEKRGPAPCTATCPAHIPVQGYVALIAQGRFQEALHLIYQSVPFPGVLGRVCPHPCEAKCRRGSEVDEPVAVCALKRFVADWGWASYSSPSISSTLSKRVAIVGAGPAGLTAACFLARQGVACDVFEALPVAGGMMAVGIPSYRLPPAVLQREIAAITALGVTIHLNHPIPPDGLPRLREQYDAVFVATGTHQSREINIPGQALSGVYAGVDFLRAVNLAAIGTSTAAPPCPGQKVVVVGGGDVAIDAARVARRYGGQQVTILYRRTRTEMPAEPQQVAEAEQEGIQMHFLAAPVRALGQDGALTGLECIRMTLGQPDESGRRRPVPIPGSEFILECDTLLTAIGQTVGASFMGLSLTSDGTYATDPLTLQTKLPGVFAGGDAVSGPATVIAAVAAGKRAAESILRYLRGEDLVQGRTGEPLDLSTVTYHTPEHPVQRPRVQMPCLPVTRRSGFAEVELGLSQEQAVAEAQRCLACGVCSECLACVSACQAKAINHNAVGERVTLTIDAVILADAAQAGALADREGVYTLATDDPLAASALAAQVMADLACSPQPVRPQLRFPLPEIGFTAPRLGLFVCRCGDKIGSIVDATTLVKAGSSQAGVVCAQEVAFACQPEAAAAIHQAVMQHRLNRVVLAACACCALDQVCYSCTTQRLRCKTNLGVLAADSTRLRQTCSDIPLPFEFVNIREQCAWLHADDPEAATSEAGRLIRAAMARANAGRVVPACNIVHVDQARCRACSTCVNLCEFHAPRLIADTNPAGRLVSWIDPTLCRGCGTCLAHCPSGAILADYATDEQIEAALAALLAPAGPVASSHTGLSPIVVLTCNWHAYSGLETAGYQRLSLPAGVRPLKVACLGRLHPGLILKAFARGAGGVLLLGCPPGECHYEFGNRRAEELFATTRSLAYLLGITEERLRLGWVAAGDSDAFARQVRTFAQRMAGDRK